MTYKKKKSKKNLTIGIGIFLLVALFIFGSQTFTLDDLQGSGLSGATVFSIDTVQTSGNADDTEWVISLSMNGGAEKVTGRITPEEVSRFNLRSIPQEPFVIDFQLSDVQCNYDAQATNMVVGELYNAQIDEQCLGMVCPYDYINVDDVIKKCVAEGGEDCENMVELSALGFGTHTEWCSWMPEESNIADPLECQNIVSSNSVKCRTHPSYPEGCGVCKGDACLDYFNQNNFQPASWWLNYGGDLCCFNVGNSNGIATDNGDWNVQSMGIVPSYQVQEIQTTPMTSYNGKVTVTFDDGTVYEALIDEKTNVASLGELGSVKWVGNLVGTQFCPQPSINTGLLKDLSTGEYKSVSAGAGSNYQSYLDTLNELTRTDADHYTFTLVSPTSIKAIDPAVGGDVIFTSYTKLNSLYNDLAREQKTSDCAYNTLTNRYECQTDNPVVLPLLKLTIKSSEVGIIVPDGKPEILGISTKLGRETQANYTEKIQLNPSQLTKLYVGIKNVGSEDDSFDVSIDCPFPLSQQSDRLSILSGKIGTSELVVSGDGLIQNCKVRANSVSFPENRDEELIDVVINPTCDQYGVSKTDMIFTQYGCFAQVQYPTTPCNNDEFWLDSLRKCISFDDISTGEERLEILEQVANEDCGRQCNGNQECTLACIDNGNVKPVCTGIGQMMTLNDYLCDFDKQPNLMLPSTLQNKVWVDAPVCNYVCEWGYEGKDCTEVTRDVQFSYDTRPPTSTLNKGTAKCETCFDGIKNQDEGEVDCGGICEEKYGRDMQCGKLRAPDHCYNHLVDGDEEDRDCGGSCDFSCDDVWKPSDSSTIPKPINTGIFIILGIGAIIILTLLVLKKKQGKGKRK